MKLSVSILNSEDKKEMIKLLNKTDISYIHLDVMDGVFVSQKSLPINEINDLSRLSEKKIDVHLMTQNPKLYLEEIAGLPNIEQVTIHLEIDRNIKEILQEIKSYGYKAGLSIKPNTPVEKLLPYLEDIDLVLVMTVEPGLGGQPFLPSSISKVKHLRSILPSNIQIEVDGGINNMTIKDVPEADIAVVGSYITTSSNPKEKIDSLLV